MASRMMADLSDNGLVYIGDAPIGEVFYWLSLDTDPGPVVAEGSISGSEEMMRRIQAAQQVRLVLLQGSQRLFAVRLAADVERAHMFEHVAEHVEHEDIIVQQQHAQRRQACFVLFPACLV